jgi:hypothetical protein
MCTTEEKFLTNLTSNEYRVLDIICTLSIKGKCTEAMDMLAKYAQCSEESVRRAIRGLEQANLLTVERTKRNLGKLYKNVYFLSSPSHKNTEVAIHKNEDESSAIHKNEVGVIHKNVGSTADISNINNLLIENKTTSYFMFGAEHVKKRTKEIIVGRGWQDDDADLVGFGLFDDELPSAQKGATVSKRSSKTRNLRPQEEWTALDVAAEFSHQIYQKLPGIMHAVNTLNMQKIIARNRKQFDLTPIIELEVMRLFFEDSWFRSEAPVKPHYIQGRFLKFFTSHLPTALKNLGLNSDISITETEAISAKQAELVYASDGTAFDNSMPGRKDLEFYEQKLRTNGSANY